MSRPLKLAIAGCGRIVEVGYLAAVRRVSELELVALADPDPRRRERAGRAAPDGSECFESVAAMLERTRPDLLVVASPPQHHLEHAELAATCGVATLVEKPPARDGAEAERMAQLEPHPWIGFNRRFTHLPALADRLPSAGELSASLRISYRRSSWRAHQVRSGALEDLGPHLADLTACLLGPLSSARAVTIESERAELELTGARGRARLVCETDRPWSERVEVRDRTGGLAARSSRGGLAAGLGMRLRNGDHPLVASLALQLRALARAAAGGDSDRLARAADGALAMRALDAARRSAACGGRAVPL